MTIFLFVVGIALLIIGAEALVRGASRVAAASGISPLIVGLTVVAFGTSSPEMAVSIGASLGGEGDVALGNVIGSNIFNILFILGVSAAIAPLVVSHQLVRLDVPLMIIVSALVFLLVLDRHIGRLDGVLLVAGIAAYTAFLIWTSRRGASASQDGESGRSVSRGRYTTKSILLDGVYIVSGLAMLVIGADWLVDGAVVIAGELGISELVIGLTIIAAGTSLPEVATSVLASLRGEREIAVGNVVGSNLFNILAVLGLSGIVAPAGIEVAQGLLTFDIPVMTAVAFASLPVLFTGYTIACWEGWVFLGYYVAYAAYLVLRATDHDLLPAFSTVMMLFVLPITVLTLALLAVRAVRSRAS